jgi:hypothetical protein
MAIKGRDPVRSKMVISNDIMEQINTFSYPGCYISYQYEKRYYYFSKNIITRALRPSEGQKHTRLNMRNILLLPTLLYRCQTCAIRDSISRNEIYEDNSKIHMAR